MHGSAASSLSCAEIVSFELTPNFPMRLTFWSILASELEEIVWAALRCDNYSEETLSHHHFEYPSV